MLVEGIVHAEAIGISVVEVTHWVCRRLPLDRRLAHEALCVGTVRHVYAYQRVVEHGLCVVRGEGGYPLVIQGARLLIDGVAGVRDGSKHR